MAAIAVLAGCGLGPTRPPENAASTTTDLDPWAVRRTRLGSVEAFSLVGRAAIQAGEQGYSAGLRWSQSGADYALELTGPFSQGTLRIQGGPAGVALTNGGETVRAESLEALLGPDFGWQVPAESLRFWVLGLPSPAWPAEQLGLDDQGRLKDMRQGPWRVSVLEYAGEEPLALPRRVFVNGTAASLRLAIREFLLQAPPLRP